MEKQAVQKSDFLKGISEQALSTQAVHKFLL